MTLRLSKFQMYSNYADKQIYEFVVIYTFQTQNHKKWNNQLHNGDVTNHSISVVFAVISKLYGSYIVIIILCLITIWKQRYCVWKYHLDTWQANRQNLDKMPSQFQGELRTLIIILWVEDVKSICTFFKCVLGALGIYCRWMLSCFVIFLYSMLAGWWSSLSPPQSCLIAPLHPQPHPWTISRSPCTILNRTAGICLRTRQRKENANPIGLQGSLSHPDHPAPASYTRVFPDRLYSSMTGPADIT